MKIRPVLIVFISLLVLLHTYIGLRLLPWLPLPAQALGLLMLAASCLLMPMVPRFWRTDHPLLIWLSTLSMGFFSWVLVLTVIRDAALGLAGLAMPLPEAVVRDSALAVAGLSVLVTLLGLVFARRTAKVVEVDIPVADLPPGLDGFTIVQISDIHVGPTIKGNYLEAIVARVNSLEADVVAITGDLVDGSVEDLSAHTASLANINARHGTFFVTGNHEYYSGAHAWVVELRRLGVTVLINEHVALDHDGHPVTLAGVTDYSAHLFDEAHRSDPHRALAGAPEQGPKLLLAHQPRSAAAAEAAGFDVQLSGHTHGGQFWPWNHFVPLQQPFVAGLKQLGGLWVYTSRGTGYWGPPMRFGAPSEITRVRLRRAV
ncbi:hypothetical protein EV700_2617 [Fluviicoccus keumensis]|uniref:Calcineurin-like phosphoesterase domain-containing protein n=1 Tax=Fluviicoccus keumensis TaxID=1435465 RepID=A0A4Q7YLU0_9GAMM|nr:metallophosphoesterase [Fluviicoccus keumensis]RZU38682.1 hypothetical protein EV700_2617 [Fluviicoccus keumensis]